MSGTQNVRHRPDIDRTRETRGREMWGRTYQHRCTCGHVDERHHSRQMAEVDRNRHIAALPRVPAAQQCKDPRRHDRRIWEPCDLCADQLDLFAL